ncbi:Gfo/Idh/MocA family oxidoreductase [Glutamicibacter sp. MNS18]|uniref:Gfo/Idh/MocA family protein n=1 Tax=Glutamicibacter sp. MNS18 TaxID=2989817 RepID=UPI00223663B0|nr:Gfo/Idh/MocA family oxidoreductase [Glutamicibacter sp. MNS18]MCW4466362.1 Gfo/Idh/MocA family oxidoreductase [Glutamicibacter sp. MNS18]
MQRFALIGAGFIGSIHARNLAANPDVDFSLVYDVDQESAESLAHAHGARAARSLDEVFDSRSIDAVFIASSTNTHAANLRRAAASGIAALVEKPIDIDLRQARDTVAAVERAGIRAMVNFNRRFDRDHSRLKALVEAGNLGPLYLLQLTSRGPALPPLDYLKVSGGQMRDQTVHFFDLARWIHGSDPQEVFVAGAALTDPRVAQLGDVDTSAATLRFASGALAQIDSVRHTGYGYDERIEVLGADGMAESGRLRAGNITVFRGAHSRADGLHVNWFERVQPTYALALQGFVDALERDTDVPVPLRDGLKAQAIAEAATRSLSSGRSERIDYGSES